MSRSQEEPIVWFRGRDKKKVTEAQKALESAQASVKEAEERGQEVTAVAEALKRIRERNHFAEQLEEIIIRRRGLMR